VFRTAEIQKNLLILIGIILLSYIIIILAAPKSIADYTVTDTDYSYETGNRLLLKTAYEYTNIEGIQSFPKTIGQWESYDFKYPDDVYKTLNAKILMSRAYTKSNGDLVWMDIINSKVGESFHKQKISVEGAGWTVDKESIAEFTIAAAPNPYTKLYANRLDISKGNERQILVYWFLFKKFGSNDAVTMIRLTAPVAYNETATFDSIKSFVELNLFHAMYVSSALDTATVAEDIISKYGNIGMFAITLSVLVPICLVFVGIRRKNKILKE
jgi:hypothetical protein